MADVERPRLIGTGPLPQQRAPIHRAEQAPDSDGPDVHAFLVQALCRVPNLAQPADALDQLRRAVVRFRHGKRPPIAVPGLPQARLRPEGPGRWYDANSFHVRIMLAAVAAGELRGIAPCILVQE